MKINGSLTIFYCHGSITPKVREYNYGRRIRATKGMGGGGMKKMVWGEIWVYESIMPCIISHSSGIFPYHGTL